MTPSQAVDLPVGEDEKEETGSGSLDHSSVPTARRDHALRLFSLLDIKERRNGAGPQLIYPGPFSRLLRTAGIIQRIYTLRSKSWRQYSRHCITAGVRRRGKHGKVEKVVGVSSASLFPARKREALILSGN